MKYIFLLSTIVLLAVGQILFKLSAGHAPSSRWAFLLSPPFLAALVTYAAATLLWVFTLRFWPLSVAYAAQALTIAIVLTISVLIFGETLTQMQCIGAAIILAGLIVLALG
ncbi:SMR family transporter [Microvirga arabica]|uniref:SMR family transporter n=1 Tax=Microvirga arabica TaxID=1128671 RepID=UPI00193AB7FC|nr:SMR family transporter [Microvirga arabica]MBM1173047.1 EamA family transporter [Microvirga arabica]